MKNGQAEAYTCLKQSIWLACVNSSHWKEVWGRTFHTGARQYSKCLSWIRKYCSGQFRDSSSRVFLPQLQPFQQLNSRLSQYQSLLVSYGCSMSWKYFTLWYLGEEFSYHGRVSKPCKSKWTRSRSGLRRSTLFKPLIYLHSSLLMFVFFEPYRRLIVGVSKKKDLPSA